MRPSSVLTHLVFSQPKVRLEFPIDLLHGPPVVDMLGVSAPRFYHIPLSTLIYKPSWA